MKYLLNLLFLSILFITSCYAQSKIEVGITTEGSWCMKSEAIMGYYYPGKSNWGSGLGGYITVPVWWRFSISSGLGYRYAQFQKGEPISSPPENGVGPDQVYSFDWMKFHRNYIVVPLTLRLYLSSKFHATGGFEVCRLLGYDTSSRQKPEYNRIIGFGSRIGKLNCELKYVKGLKEQHASTVKTADVHNNDKNKDWFIYRTSMLQLSLSYPLWQK